MIVSCILDRRRYPLFLAAAALLLVSTGSLRGVSGTPSQLRMSNVRRLTRAGGTGEDDDHLFGEYAGRCGRLDYELHLAIGIHFSLYAQPTDPGAANHLDDEDACRPLMLHADSSGEDGKAKEVYEVERKELPLTFFEDGSLSLGTFRFLDIANAFNAIDADASGWREYNIVTNNCAVLILGMMRALGIQLSSDDRAKVVKGLVAADKEADNKLATYIRESGEIERSLGLTEGATNEQLLERLTLRQIELALDSVPPNSYELQHQNRGLIIGGDPVNSQEFPYIVEPESLPGFEPCSAVLVAPDVILTTISCEYPFTYSTRVLVGSYRRGSTDGPAQWRNITSDITKHPGFDYVANSYFIKDFAMMKIEAVTLPNLVPVELNAKRITVATGKNLTVLGYGKPTRGPPSNAVSDVLRKASVSVARSKFCKVAADLTFNDSDAFCASSPNQYPCYGDDGGPVIDENGTLVGLVKLEGKCVTGGLPKLQLHILPELICPPDLRLLGDDTATTIGGAFLPRVDGSLLKPPLTNVTQFPAPGKRMREDTSVVVTVKGTTPSNQTLSCQWRVTVAYIWFGFFVQFRAGPGNTTISRTYDLVYPQVGRFYGVLAFLDELEPAMTKKSVIKVVFRRFDPNNATDVERVHSIRVKGKKDLLIQDIIDSPVHFPDYKYRYQVDFKARGLTRGGKIQYLLYSQQKKM